MVKCLPISRFLILRRDRRRLLRATERSRPGASAPTRDRQRPRPMRPARSAARQSRVCTWQRAAAPAAARQALEYLHHARMLARIVVGALVVPCADRCACHADGNDAGAVREVGGACCRRGWHGLVAVLGALALPGCPARR